MKTGVLSLLQGIPSKKHWEGNLLVFEPTAPALDYIRNKFPDAKWDEGSLKFCQVADNMRALSLSLPKVVKDYDFKTKPYDHQLRVFRDSRDRECFALLMEQGTGKTKVILDTAAWLYSHGKIGGVLIIAKNGVHRNWVDVEIPTHLPEWCNPVCSAWSAQRGEKGIRSVLERDTAKPGLAILAINVEALSTKRGEKICERFLLQFPSLVVVDESTCIKTPGAKRTKAVLRLAGFAGYRRILTGTPVTNGPLDAYSQFAFLDEDILGFGSFYTFRARYAVLQDLPGKNYRGRPVQIVVAYQNLDELQEKIKQHSFRVLKKDCLDLPEKIYQKHIFQLTDEQQKHYEDMVENIQTEFQGRVVSAPLAMTRMLRLHQISCGFMPAEVPGEIGVAIGSKNPRLEALTDLLENISGKVIIYATYRFNLREIWTALQERYGKSCAVAYSGSVSNDNRARAIEEFQNPNSPARFFVGQTEAAGYGLTLTAAETVIYYSNNHKLETRLQSEDRAHRIGQKKNVLYIDLCAENTIDEDITEALIAKNDIACKITGDKVLDWIRGAEVRSK
jgi:hypothetical protein